MGVFDTVKNVLGSNKDNNQNQGQASGVVNVPYQNYPAQPNRGLGPNNAVPGQQFYQPGPYSNDPIANQNWANYQMTPGQAQTPQPVQSTVDYQKQVIQNMNAYPQNNNINANAMGQPMMQQQAAPVASNQPYYTPRRDGSGQMMPQQPPVQPRRVRRVQKGPQVFLHDEYYMQTAFDIDAPQPIDYGNYQDPNELQRMQYDYNYYREQRQAEIPQYQAQTQYNNAPNGYRGANAYNKAIDYDVYGVAQVYDEQVLNANGYYEAPRDNAIYQNVAPINQFEAYATPQYQRQTQAEVNRNTVMLPAQIAKEIRSEKLRVFIFVFLGAIGIIFASIFIAAYYNLVHKPTGSTFAGFKFGSIPYPFFSIVMLIAAVLFFCMGLTDYSLLYSNVKKYERDLLFGRETVPYFITRNYRNLISRGVYVTWIAFATYIIGAILLGILYGLQGLYENNNREIYFLFWKFASLKSFKSEITVNIIVLIVMLAGHILNIVWSRARKNNIIGYYGQPVISSEEERQIRKRANRICIIIMCVVLAIILFAIVIPWLIVRKRRGKLLSPFGLANR